MVSSQILLSVILIRSEITYFCRCILSNSIFLPSRIASCLQCNLLFTIEKKRIYVFCIPCTSIFHVRVERCWHYITRYKKCSPYQSNCTSEDTKMTEDPLYYYFTISQSQPLKFVYKQLELITIKFYFVNIYKMTNNIEGNSNINKRGLQQNEGTS